MAGLKQIKGKIRATDRTRKVTKAMEAVSAVKMRKSQERALGGRAYARSAIRVLARVSGSLEKTHHPLTTMRGAGKMLVVLVTSDKGLAGSLNAAVIKEAQNYIAGRAISDVQFICFGRRGYEFFAKRGYTVLEHFINVQDAVAIADMNVVTARATAEFMKGTISRVVVVYQNFKSTFEQEPVTRTLLPLQNTDIQTIIDGITPDRGAFSVKSVEKSVSTYSVEPSESVVLDVLLPKLAGVVMYHAMLEAKASEHSARMVAMKNASDKARDVSKSLNLTYNKIRQAVITREVSEITGGIEAMAMKE